MAKKATKTTSGQGKITQVLGAVVDVAFDGNFPLFLTP